MELRTFFYTFWIWTIYVTFTFAQSGTLQFTSFPTGVVTIGQPVTLTWTGGDPNAPVTITLKKGPSTDLNDVGVITSSATGGSYTWTPDTTLADGDGYVLYISQGTTENNYSSQFSITGASTLVTTSTAAATSTPTTSPNTTPKDSPTNTPTTTTSVVEVSPTTTTSPGTTAKTGQTTTSSTETSGSATSSGANALTSNTAPSGTIASSSTSTSTSSSPPAAAAGLSVGAKAGIGTGVPIGVFILGALAFWLGKRSRGGSKDPEVGGSHVSDKHIVNPERIQRGTSAQNPPMWHENVNEAGNTERSVAELHASSNRAVELPDLRA